jgi:tRNA dimethylallyltransferase
VKVIVISGPTATGKTDISIELARQFGGEIVNFDSLVLYKEITIGTAKPTPEEQGEIPHHMVGVASISQPLNAADYAKLALPIINKLLSEKKMVYLVGGSGFYLQALVKGMYDSPTTAKDITLRSDKLYEESGITPFLEILKKEDPLSFERYHENDHYRVRRAVEHFWNTGTPLSSERARKDQENEVREESNIHGWDLLQIHLDMPREEHFEIIKKRTDRMLATGLREEVEGLLQQGFTGEEKPLQSIGYKEVLELRSGELADLEACRERINISTRQLAKAQRTWFNRTPGKHTFHPLSERNLISALVADFLRSPAQ